MSRSLTFMKGIWTAVLCKDRHRYSDLGVTRLFKFTLQRAWLCTKWYLYKVIPCSAVGRAGDQKQLAETLYLGTLCSSLMRNRMLCVGSSKKQESSRKTSTSALLTMPKPLTVWITTNCGKSRKRWEYQTTWPASWETCMQVRKQQLEPDVEQQTGSK